MKIRILEGNWGAARPEDIQKLLEDVASHIVRRLREPFNVTIHVVNLPTEATPKAFYGRRDDPVRSNPVHMVNLTAKDHFWSQFAYQFGHEFCHVLSGHDRLRHSVANQWFHESICELASLFVLHQMAKHWPTDPPYPNWAEYSVHLGQYVNTEMAKHKKAAPQKPLGACGWLRNNENRMRQDPYLRDKNGVVAFKLFPIFKEKPQVWNAVRHLPASEDRIIEYIEAWETTVHKKDRKLVEKIGQVFS